MVTGIDWRKFPRISSRIEVALVLDEKPVRVQAQTENISTGGVCVILQHEVEKFDTLSMKLQLDDNLPEIDCTGRIVWTIPKRVLGKSKTTYDTGIQFTDIKDDDVNRIKNFISREERR